MVSRVNLGLLFANQVDADAMIQLANNNCADLVDGYCLGERSAPHITLCQFDAPEERIGDIWDAARELLSSSIPIRFSHLYFKPGSKEHENYLWCGLAARADEMLITLQNAVYKLVASFELKTHTSSQNYFPHLTWARIKSIPVIKSWPNAALWEKSHLFYPALGLSEPNGAWVKTLYAKTA